jgi:hypothetical protein
MKKTASTKIIISLLTIAFAASLIYTPIVSAARYTSYTLTVNHSVGGTVTPGTS